MDITVLSSILFTNARLNALENILWGHLNVVLEDWEEGASKEYRRMFYRFYIEQIGELKSQLPDVLANNPAMERMVENQIREIESMIESLT